MTAPEAMASGKPVIAPNEGGYAETVLTDEIGILINDIDEIKLIEAIKKIEVELKNDSEKYKHACLRQAEKFSVQIFINKIKKTIEYKKSDKS